MVYDRDLAARVRDHLTERKGLEVKEKTMFGGLAFMINGKMCINVVDNRLMCRFSPHLTEDLSKKPGFLPMVMNGRRYKGYCYVDPVGYESKGDFVFWVNLCLDFNDEAKPSIKKRNKR